MVQRSLALFSVLMVLTLLVFCATSILPSIKVYLLVFCRIVIVLVFVSSFSNKVMNLRQFEITITQFRIIHQNYSSSVAKIFLALELTVALLVAMSSETMLFGFIMAIFLLLTFCFALISVLSRNIRVPCSCFGSTNKLVDSIDIWRNAGFILCALSGCTTYFLLGGNAPTLGVVEGVLIGLAAALFAVVWVQLKDIVQLFS